MSAGIPRLEQGTIVLETIMIPISPYTYTRTIPIFERCQCHQNSVFSPLCHEQWEKARVGRGGVEPPSSDFQSAALTTSATTPKFHLFNCHKWQNLNMSFLTHFSLFSQSYFCYIYIILQIFSKSKCKTIKNKTQVSILSLLRLILEYMLCLTWIVFICTQ